MQRVVVTIEAIQERRLLPGLVLKCEVRLLALGRREVDRSRALWPTPVALAHEEGTPDGTRVNLTRLGFYKIGLVLKDGAGPTLVIDTENLGAQLKPLARRGWWERLKELDQTLAVDDTGMIKVGYTGDLDSLLGSVEVDDFLGFTLESWPDVSKDINNEAILSDSRRMTG